MNHLVPCRHCERHVRADEASCPFCAAPVDAGRAVPGAPTRRLGRAATFAFGASLALGGCGATHVGDDAATPSDAGQDAGADAGPLTDAGPDAGRDAGPPFDAGMFDAGLCCPLYGGAPGD